MTWEWEHGGQGGRWVMDVSGWHAEVQRVSGRAGWQATLTRISAAEEQYVNDRTPNGGGFALARQCLLPPRSHP